MEIRNTLTLESPSPFAETSAGEVAFYRREVYLPVEAVLGPEEVAQASAGLENCIELLRSEHRSMRNGYGEVWAHLENRLKVQFQPGHEPERADDPSASARVRKYHDFVGVEPFLTEIALRHRAVQNVLAALIGPGAELMQDMALVNPPGIGTGKPWHQDDAYFRVLPLEAVCAVWIALDEATVDNGCMHFWPGSNGSVALRHYHGSDCEILPDRLEGVTPVPVPLRAGGAVFFSGLAPHMTYPNRSRRPRRALQFHYRAAESRLVDDAEYDAAFRERDGTAASCSAAARRGF